MDVETQTQLRQLNERISGVTAAVGSLGQDIRKDLQYMGRLYAPVIGMAALSLILSICALVIALENRSLILAVSSETTKNTRDLENIYPMVFQTPTPEPKK